MLKVIYNLIVLILINMYHRDPLSNLQNNINKLTKLVNTWLKNTNKFLPRDIYKKKQQVEKSTGI